MQWYANPASHLVGEATSNHVSGASIASVEESSAMNCGRPVRRAVVSA